MSNSRNLIPSEKIAIIGIGCRFPGGANDYRTFWHNLISGKDCLTDTPKNRYDAASLYSKDKAKVGRLTGGRGGYIDGFDEFDPAFFGIGPREAQCMDPQQRKLLEVAWEALEDGGLKPLEMAGQNVGVFIGGFTLDYKIVQFADLSFNGIAAHTATGTMMTLLSNRLSYFFDFRGPSMSVDTACSSSLVTVHLACRSLAFGETNLALAGGALLHMTPQYTVAESKGGFLSPEGRSCTFDAEANGYVRAEGVGLVVLKRLCDALRDNDPIHAVIIGSGVNQDGRTNGITVPSADAQTRLIRQVCDEANIVPGDLQYVEAHGTSTPVGDPIEVGALGMVLAEGRGPGQKCFVGSVKTNIGHTEAAAGVAGLIKTALSLKHQIIPPHINLSTPNPKLNLAAQPFAVPVVATAWPEHEGPARAGVNSFGFGGTNAHVLLEAPPQRTEVNAHLKTSTSILPMTARDDSYFPAMAKRLAAQIAQNPQEVPNIIYSLAHHRQSLEANRSLVFKSSKDLLAVLQALELRETNPNIIAHNKLPPSERRLVWVFTGMGPQWWGMGRQLFATEPVYRAVIEECDRAIKKFASWSLIHELNVDEAESNMAQTWLAQPANFAMQVALAALWRSYGIKPDAIVGHSTGEAAAFYEAGVYSFDDAVKIIIHRSRLQQQLIGMGTMLAVSLTEPEAKLRIAPYGDRISIAAINSPTAMTLSGEVEPLTELAEELQSEQVFAKFLTVGVPYHSAKMELIKDQLFESLADITAQEATLPLYLTGRTGKACGLLLDANYWWNNVRDCVRFSDAIDLLCQDGFRLFLEIGPHPVLAHAISECLTKNKVAGQMLASVRRQEDENERFKRSLAAIHNMGFAINWDAMVEGGTQVSLPCYPWKGDRYWLEDKSVAQVRLGQVDHPLLGRRMSTANPAWELLLDLEHLPYLSDHRIEGNTLFPAAGYIEMAFQAMRALTGQARQAVTDIELRKALFVPDFEVKPVQFLFNPEQSTFTIATTPNLVQEPIIHATGAFSGGQVGFTASPWSLGNIKANSQLNLPGHECYQTLADMGYHYGPAFSPIRHIFINTGEALAEIVPTEILGPNAHQHHFHPTLLDACFQTLLATEFLESSKDPSGIRLPVTIKEIRTTPIGCQPIWAHARIVSRSSDEIIGDITIYDEQGQLLGQVSGFVAANVEKVSAKVNLATIDSWLCEMGWIEKPLGEENLKAQSTGTWVILGDQQGVGQAVLNILNERHEHGILVSPAVEFSFDLASRQASVAPCSQEHFAQLLAALSTSELPPCHRVINLWPLDTKPFNDCVVSDLISSNSYATYPLIALAKAMLSAQSSARLFVVTRGAQAVGPHDQLQPLAASAWGAARVLWYQEMISNDGVLIDLDPSVLDVNQEALRIVQEATQDDEGEIAFRSGTRYTSRLGAPESLSRPLALKLRGDGCYLVTGAFGALGQWVCRTLVKRGARRLILMSRSVLPDRKEWSRVTDTRRQDHINFIHELECLGATIILAPVDVTEEGSLKNWLQEFNSLKLPPIRGVFHLAGLVRDTLVTHMDAATFDAAYEPKVLGAFNLHRHLSDQPLEHFVLFSSIASVLTTAGQTNYAAGNAFLDGLAHYRRAQGLPGLSLNWGPWATGMIEELGLIEHYRNSRGMSSLAPEVGMDVLERVMGQDSAQLLVATIVDWPLFLAWYPKFPPLVVDIAAHHKDTSQAADSDGFVEQFKRAPADQALSLVANHFIQVVSDVLRLKFALVNPSNSLNELGLDSLLAIELRARIQRELKVALPVVTLLGADTIKDLTVKLHDQLVKDLGATSLASLDTNAVKLFTNPCEYPLTHNQTALWFLKHLDPDGFAYNIGGAVEIRAQLNPELMFEAVRTLIKRHPSLRANFVQKNGQATQIISDEIKADLGLVDVEGREWNDVYQMIIREYRKPYDLATDALMRFRLYRLGSDRFVMMKAVHHIISDAISTFVFIEELLEVYEGLRQGKKIELPPLKASYLDFLNWQNRMLASPQAARMLEYWQGHLPKEIPNLNLPTDKPRPAVLSHNGSSHFFVLDEVLTKRVHELAKQQGMTVFMVLLSAYYTLLHRYSGQDNIIVGSPVLGRTEQEFAQVYGYFVNPLPLHAEFSANPTTLGLMEQVQKIVLNGLDNQEYPFVMLVDKLGLKHDPSRSRVFQAMFILLAHRVATEQYGYRLQYIELPEEEGQFDLTMSAYEDEAEGRFHCVFKYNSDLFLPNTIERMATHYVNLLTAMLDSPTMPVAKLDMLSRHEKNLILDEWSGANNQQMPTQSVVEMFNAQAALAPKACAVAMPLESGVVQYLSYEELAARSELLSQNLRRLGVTRGSVVGICLPKSIDLIVATLAVLKVGAAYLPLDPDYPAERLVYMLNHANAQLLLVDEASREHLGAWSGTAMCINSAELNAVNECETTEAFSLDDTAYIVYTSGSTGQPKAVPITHRNWASVYLGWEDHYRLKTDVRIHAQMASFSFDVFAGDFARALCSGGTLVLVDRNLLFNTEKLYNTLVQEKVDCAEFVPAVVRGIIRFCQAHNRRLDFMRLLIVGSDAWTIAEMQELKSLCDPRHRVVNSYGLSETTIDSTCFEGSTSEHPLTSQMVPIGRPFKNSAIYVLDKHQNPAPIGVAGELYIAGLGVSEGYLAAPELTSLRFLSLRLNHEPVRLYRTGDLAMFDIDGVVKLLGRADNQVKVRGFRIEVGEIEMQLKSLPAIADALVILRKNNLGEPQLCAYCVPVGEENLNVIAIRKALGQKLPSYMHPQWIQTIEAFPLSKNGKVDIQALPSPFMTMEATDEPPQTFYEVRMAAHWMRLLNLTSVGLSHDFFEVGGSSIKLIELIYHVQSEFNIEIAVSQLFKATTLYGMAKTLEHIIIGREAGSKPYLLFNAGQQQNLFCFPPAGGHGLVYRRMAEYMPAHTLVSFNYLTDDNKVAIYADIIESWPTPAPICLFGYSLGGNLAFLVAKELEKRGKKVAKVVIMDSYRISEHFEFGDEHLAEFESELSEHLLKHTGSNIVAEETLEQARNYIKFCSRTLNLGSLAAELCIISDEHKINLYAEGEKGAWHGSSLSNALAFKGFGSHADMLDVDFVAQNAKLTLSILEGRAHAQ